MPYKDPEARRVYMEAYRKKNRDRLAALSKEHYEKRKAADPEKLAQQSREANQRRKAADPEAYRLKAAEGTRRYRARHPEKIVAWRASGAGKESSRKSRLKRRQEVLAAYGGCCSCCGESQNEFLCIDHANGNGSTHRREMGVKDGAGPIYTWLRMHNYPEGFQVLCHNCNLARGFYGYCPHALTSQSPGVYDAVRL